MTTLNDGFNAIADLALWYKLQNDEQLTLGDLRELIPARWIYIRDNWNFIREDILSKADTYEFPQSLRNQVNDFDDFIEIQRNSKNNGNPFSNSTSFFRFQAIFDSIDLNSLTSSNSEQRTIEQIIKRVKSFIKTDFLDIRNKIRKAYDEQSDLLTGSDPDYNRIYNRESVGALQAITANSVQLLETFSRSIRTCDYILANLTDLNTVTVDPFAVAKLNANNPDFDVQSSSAGYLVRMQHNDTLSNLALRYLGDSDRWIEIAIANGLKAPYIDEAGETQKMISSGSGNQISLAALDSQGLANIDKFYINQIVFLFSDTLPFIEQRTITAVTVTPISGEVVLRLSGELDLDKFKKTENASIRYFKPNTINSQFFILIPTVGETAPNPGDVPWFLKTKQADERQAGIDLALSADYDLIFSSSGDLVLSYGIANAIQAVQIKLSTEYGSLNRHSDFGIVNVIGRSTNNNNATREELAESIVQAIESDSRFSTVQSIKVAALNDTTTTGFLVQLVVRLAGTGSTIPISFTVNL